MLQLFSFPFSAMASACAVHLYGDDQIGVEAVAEAAMAEVARIEQRYSRYCFRDRRIDRVFNPSLGRLSLRE